MTLIMTMTMTTLTPTTTPQMVIGTSTAYNYAKNGLNFSARDLCSIAHVAFLLYGLT